MRTVLTRNLATDREGPRAEIYARRLASGGTGWGCCVPNDHYPRPRSGIAVEWRRDHAAEPQNIPPAHVAWVALAGANGPDARMKYAMDRQDVIPDPFRSPA